MWWWVKPIKVINSNMWHACSDPLTSFDFVLSNRVTSVTFSSSLPVTETMRLTLPPASCSKVCEYHCDHVLYNTRQVKRGEFEFVRGRWWFFNWWLIKLKCVKSGLTWKRTSLFWTKVTVRSFMRFHKVVNEVHWTLSWCTWNICSELSFATTAVDNK